MTVAVCLATGATVRTFSDAAIMELSELLGYLKDAFDGWRVKNNMRVTNNLKLIDERSRHTPIYVTMLSESSLQVQAHNDPASPAPLSKNAIKKAKKAERHAALKLERRVREKEKKKEKKLLKAHAREMHETDTHSEEEDGVDREGQRRGEKRARLEVDRGAVKLKGKEKPVVFGARVIVDLGFDEFMNENVCPTWPSAKQRPINPAGDKISGFSTSIHIQCKPTNIFPVLSTVHFPQWAHISATERCRRRSIQTMDEYRVVGGWV
jgi:hypothetical protein